MENKKKKVEQPAESNEKVEEVKSQSTSEEKQEMIDPWDVILFGRRESKPTDK
jgi:hypothetical protein